MNELTDKIEEIRMSPEMQAFGVWLANRWTNLRTFFGTLGTKGWRPMFCAGLGLVALWADKIAFVELMAARVFIPEGMLIGLIGFNILVLAAMGIRTFEKLQFGMLAIEQTARLNVDNNNAQA